MFKKAQIPVRVFTTVAYPLTEKEDTTIKVVTDVFLLLDDGIDFFPEFGGNAFITVDDQNPFIAEGEIFQRPVFFLGPTTIKVKLHNGRTITFGNFLRAIAALGVYHKDFISYCHTLQTGGKIGLLVFGRD